MPSTFPMNELRTLELAAAELKAEVIADGAFTVRCRAQRIREYRAGTHLYKLKYPPVKAECCKPFKLADCELLEQICRQIFRADFILRYRKRDIMPASISHCGDILVFFERRIGKILLS